MSAQALCDLLGRSAGERVGYRELASLVRMLVLDGRLSPGTRLPSERSLTAALPASRTTVTRAYDELRERGFAVSRPGSGTTVTLPRDARQPRLVSPSSSTGADTIGWTIAAGQAAAGVGRAYARACELLPEHLGHTGYETTGITELREEVARRYCDRGLPTDAAQIVITSGALSALALAVRALGRTGQRVLVESPGYPNAIDSLRRSGLRPVGVPVGESDLGWNAQTIGALLRQTSPSWAYLIPDFHNPTGSLMPDATRAELAAQLRRSGTVPIVDETMAELALDDQPMPLPFAAHAPDALTVGSASKTFWGGLRVGWLRASAPTVSTLVQARGAYDLGTAVLEQIVVAELLRCREQVMTTQRATLRVQRAELQELLAEHLPSWSVNRPTGGLSLWATLPARVSSRLTVAAERHDLLLTAGPRFFVDTGGEQNLRLPFSRDRDDLAEAVRRLALAYADVQARKPAESADGPPALTA